jgi:hypothetical protein
MGAARTERCFSNDDFSAAVHKESLYHSDARAQRDRRNLLSAASVLPANAGSSPAFAGSE